MAKHVECLEWLCFADQLMGTTRRTMNFALMPYVTSCAMVSQRLARAVPRWLPWLPLSLLSQAGAARHTGGATHRGAARAHQARVAAGGGQGDTCPRRQGGHRGVVGVQHGDAGAGM
jgi:hypothetical protein